MAAQLTSIAKTFYRAGLLLAGAAALAAGSVATAHGEPRITGFQWQPAKKQLIFSANGPFKYHVFTLARPARVVVDFLDAHPGSDLHFSIPGDSLIRDVRSASRFSGKGERVVFDLSRPAKPRSFTRRSSAGAQLVVALGADKKTAAAKPRPRKRPAAAPKPKNQPAKPTVAKTLPPKLVRPVITAKSRPSRLRDVVIAIDAGHGGHDSGAIGPDGIEEKNVTLAITKDVYRDLASVKGVKPVLTRKGDYFVTLGGRRKLARKAHADLFVSIHADSSPYHYPKGSTVYVLSEHGATSVAARILAQHQNAVDEIGGVNLDKEEPVVRSAIVKLAQRGSIAQGLQLAQGIMTDVNRVVPLHSEKVERAPFAVLKSPDIPSILVETAFISNRQEEHQLASHGFQRRIAAAIARGIEHHVKRFAPPGTLIAARRDAIYALKQG
jgi:N-acetylmuramoyl-L-alanine amidase